MKKSALFILFTFIITTACVAAEALPSNSRQTVSRKASTSKSAEKQKEATIEEATKTSRKLQAELKIAVEKALAQQSPMGASSSHTCENCGRELAKKPTACPASGNDCQPAPAEQKNLSNKKNIGPEPSKEGDTTSVCKYCREEITQEGQTCQLRGHVVECEPINNNNVGNNNTNTNPEQAKKSLK